MNLLKIKKATLKFTLLVVGIIAASAFSTSAQTAAADPPDLKISSPKVMAVEFYADWCAGCKELMPKMADIRKSYSQKGVMVLRFDMTDDHTKAQAGFMAAQFGLDEIYKKGGGKTGFIALVDAKSKKVLGGLITRAKAPEEITKMIDDAVAKAGL